MLKYFKCQSTRHFGPFKSAGEGGETDISLMGAEQSTSVHALCYFLSLLD